MAHDVFISYSSHDKAIADAVCASLENQKIRCWIAPRDILVGQAWAAALVEAIDTSQVFVLVLSQGSNHSVQVIREVGEAVEKGIPIIPLRIEAIEPTQEMRYYIKSIHWLDALNPPMESHLEKLADTVQALLAVRQQPKEAAEPFVAPFSQKRRSLPTWGEWRPLTFNIPNEKSWSQLGEGVYISRDQASDSIAWSDEIIEDDLILCLKASSPEKDAECQIVVYGNGGGYSHGNLVFTFGKGYYKLEKHSSYHNGENWLVLNKTQLDFSGHVFDVLIEVAGEKASLYLDGIKVASAFFSQSEINHRGRIGLSRTWEMLGEVTYSEIRVRTRGVVESSG